MAGKRKRTDAPADGGKAKKTKGGPPKREREREEPSALPEPLETPEDVVEETSATPKKAGKKDSKKEKKSPKKPKTEKAAKPEESNGDVEKEEKADGATEETAPSTKSKKNKKKKAEAAEGAEEEGDGAAVEANGKKAKAPRYIVFVGNLPYTANAATIRQHFASVKPSTVRCLQKDGEENTCRGFAFIEFSDPTNMRTCLDKMHHSTFNDGLSPERKINVELTAGGGGSKSNRKDKIKARNAQLEVNRAKRIQKEQEGKKANATGEPPADDGMHPSRKARMA